MSLRGMPKILGLLLSKDHCNFRYTFMLPLNPIRAVLTPYNTINRVMNKGDKNDHSQSLESFDSFSAK